MTEPTDAELLAEWDRVSHIADAGQRRLACLRAVLAKWGTPAGAGEVVACRNCGGTGWMVRDPDIGTDQECFVCGGSGGYSESATPQPTQAQAGAVPLTDEQIRELWHDSLPNRFEAISFARAIERAHGITGGQHGAE